MDLNSPLFDRVRTRQRCGEAVATEAEPICGHPGCALAGLYRAPQGRGREGQYFHFCLDHVRAYNASYNYFKDMPDEAVAAYQKADLYGHRPTWRMGVNGSSSQGGAKLHEAFADATLDDAFDLFGRRGFSQTGAPRQASPRVGNAARKALDTLGLEPGVDKAALKARFKELVKRLHPDANSGDRSHEDQLREIINAYNYLRTAGLA
ncbi:MAG: J domain-containing protein [Hyphomicrobiales bacterium]|nr:J domain-containing protein [Hyphomicrobiales bacterium]